MGKLSTAARAALPANAFAGPGRSFPIEDKDHAEKAIQLAPRAVKAGSITRKQEKAIDTKAKAKLGNFGGKAAKPFGANPKPSAPKSSGGDENHLANQVMGKTGHVSYK